MRIKHKHYEIEFSKPCEEWLNEFLPPKPFETEEEAIQELQNYVQKINSDIAEEKLKGEQEYSMSDFRIVEVTRRTVALLF